jgi:hypothetical protein
VTGSGVIVCPLQNCVLKWPGNNEKVFVAEKSLVIVGVKMTSFVEEIVN